jgi:hypothetical protein
MTGTAEQIDRADGERDPLPTRETPSAHLAAYMRSVVADLEQTPNTTFDAQA